MWLYLTGIYKLINVTYLNIYYALLIFQLIYLRNVIKIILSIPSNERQGDTHESFSK